MNGTVRKVLSVIIIAIVIFGAVVSLNGFGSVKNIKDSLKYGLDINGGVYVVMEASNDKNLSDEDFADAMDQTRKVLNNRVNAMGVAEATVSVEGTNRIRVEMPGVEDAESAIERIGETAQLKFTLADGTEYLTGEDVKSATAEIDNSNGGYKIVMNFNPEGVSKFAEATKRAASGEVTPTVYLSDGTLVNARSVVIWLDDEILTAPTAAQEINSDSCEITQSAGGMEKEYASDTAALISGGALPLSLTEAESSVQTASIGANALDKSIIAGAIGLGIVFILMILVFNLLGLFADIALTLYVMLVLWIMSAMGAVLTLPGIAGIVLGIGMAVDANVIIFSRIREEIGTGHSIRTSVDTGFRHALVTVLDSQITTLIATVVLYELGSTTVRGFAITLMISIVVSIFTAVVVTQIFVGALASSRFAKNTFFGCKPDGTPKKWIKKDIPFIEKRKVFYAISACVIVAGIIFLGVRGFNYGIDFTGGTMIQMDMGKQVETAEVQKAVDSFGLKDVSIVLSGDNNEQIILRTTTALDNEHRIEVSNAIEEAFGLDDKAVIASEEFGPTIGNELRDNAIRAILIAALGMLLYIIFRFRSWKYGVAAIAGLAHDVLVLIGFYAIFQIAVNNPFIAAILTIVGYSINDTIVVFDRVRENSKLMRGKPLAEILDHSITQTLDRSIMTSLTTLAAIVPLLVMVSSALAVFVLPLMVGVICGTYSSVAFCSPIYYELNRKAEQSEYQRRQKAKARIEEKRQQKAKAIEAPAPAAEGQEAQAEAAAENTAQNAAKQTGKKKKNKKSGKKHQSYKRKK